MAGSKLHLPLNHEGIKKDGVHYAPFKSQFLLSSGLPSVDQISGGGFPVGTIVLLEEPKISYYSELILKHFLVEGILHGHTIFVSSLACNPKELTSSLPAVSQADSDYSDLISKLIEEEMDIAWRYQTNPKVESPQQKGIKCRKSGFEFDTCQVLPPEKISESDITYWPNSDGPRTSLMYDDLLLSVKDVVKNKGEQNNVIRIVVHGVGSALWSSSEYDVPKFLYQLRSIAQNSNSVAMVSVPSHLFKVQSILPRCLHLCDTVIAMETLEESSEFYKQYKGFIKLKKFPTVNSLSPNIANKCELAFNILRKQFTIEILHLPPNSETTSQTEKEDF